MGIRDRLPLNNGWLLLKSKKEVRNRIINSSAATKNRQRVNSINRLCQVVSRRQRLCVADMPRQ